MLGELGIEIGERCVASLLLGSEPVDRFEAVTPRRHGPARIANASATLAMPLKSASRQARRGVQPPGADVPPGLAAF